LFCKAFLGDLIPKGERYESKANFLQRGRNKLLPKRGSLPKGEKHQVKQVNIRRKSSK